MNYNIDTSLLGDVIVGRVDPQIYAFTTETIPNYLKVGDTYRPLEIRLDEWRKHYPNLIHQFHDSAKLESGNIFRDFAVHDFLELIKHYHRLEPQDIEEGIYYSREFFKDAQVDDVKEAIEDIKDSEKAKDGRYHFYTPDHLPIKLTFDRVKDFPPRDNQQQAIDKFKEAVKNGRNNLLMYAVMRFGKSFTAMCCATEMEEPAKLVLIVSAKADVRKEWQETVQSHVRFKDYEFFDGEDLKNDTNLISNTLKDNKRVALFLTLQDLQGETIKTKHQEIFKESIDLLIVDETHFGARAAEYGKVLRAGGLSDREIKSEIQTAETSDDIDSEIKQLKAKVRLHLSGTPYRILMGDEFTKDDIIAFCQYTDIIDAKEEWDKDNVDNDDVSEWDNPYYGFPQMIRFAFQPNESSIKRMKEMREEGITYAFSALFKPLSLTKKSDGSHKKFANEREILELLEIIDGSRNDDNILGFLDYDKIKKGEMCHHMVCVLPFRASCDALEALITNNKNRFKNLGEYTIINIAGVDDERTYSDTETVKAKIKSCEEAGEKTITLTVNRMLTGSTVKQWDTMLYLKDTASPQEYDQAIFRIQNQYIKVYQDSEGKEVRFNMKPQTLLVDFDPNRMFRMQELKSQFYNVNTDKNGNSKLKHRIERELIISPIITINNKLMKQVEATDVMAVVQQYSQNKSIMDEAYEVPVDFSLLDDATFRDEIETMKGIDALKGLEFSPNEGDNDDDYTIPDIDAPIDNDRSKKEQPDREKKEEEENEEENIANKFKAYQAKILFYAFLTDSRVESIEDVIYSIVGDKGNNRRIAKNLGLKVPILWILHNKCTPFILRHLDYKVKNINDLMRDNALSPIERANKAINKFARVSRSEVVTPPFLANELVSLIPSDVIDSDMPILDISTVEGEIAYAIQRKYGDRLNSRLYSIPSSPLAYELTRKIYGLLDMPIENVLDFYSYKLIGDNNEEYLRRLNTINPEIVIGVPPFSESAGGGRGDGGSAIYHKFFNFVKDNLSARYIDMMMQSTWYTGGRGDDLDAFRDYMLDDSIGNRHVREFHDYPNVETYIKGVTTLRGGICLFLWDREYDGDCLFINRFNHRDYPMNRSLRYTHGDYQADFLIRWNEGLSILEKVLNRETSFIYQENGYSMHRRNPFGFPNTKDHFSTRKTTRSNTKVYLAKGKVGYAKDEQYSHTPDREALKNKWKVLVAKSSSGTDNLPHLVISEPIVSEPGSVTANSHYIIDGVPSKIEATNLAAYMRTRFFRFMVNLLRSNQNMRVDMYQFAPRLDFTRRWTDDQLYERYDLSDPARDFICQVVRDMDSKK